ncbi:MAG: Endoribonuclease YbeY [Candidatus Omnitrophica bacterium ADurb.Bin277]|nr:MAG: Endoribonuclease YbeY [Candidatus Omnitrophica bacterium ADurb.Bin277]
MPGARELHRGFEINILNECSREVSETRLVKVAGQILRDLGFKKAVLSILLVGDRKMRELNRKYLKHAWSTDVLAFAEGKIIKAAKLRKATRKVPSLRYSAGAAPDFLGDIALCIPTIEGQAEEYGHTFLEELDYCLCHGILHLLGHDDKTRSGHKQMHQKQKQILKHILPSRSGT